MITWKEVKLSKRIGNKIIESILRLLCSETLKRCIICIRVTGLWDNNITYDGNANGIEKAFTQHIKNPKIKSK